MTVNIYPKTKIYSNTRIYAPYFHLISVPNPLYEKASYNIVVKVGSGLPFDIYINNILAASGIGTGATQNVSVLITNAMISLSAVEVRLQGLRTKTTTATCCFWISLPYAC